MNNIFNNFDRLNGKNNISYSIDLLSGSDYERYNYLLILGQTGDSEVIEPIINALKDDNLKIREAAAHVLGESGGTRTVEALKKAFQENEDPNLRGTIIESLGKLKEFETVADCIRDRNDYVRYKVALALGNANNEQYLQMLISMLKDSAAQVRGAAASALGNLGDVKAIEPLIDTLEDEWIVYSQVRDALVKIGKAAISSIIRASTYQNNYQFWSHAIEVLGKIGDPEAFEFLTKALQNEEAPIREAAAAAMSNMGDMQAGAFLVKALSDKNAEVRQSAAASLGFLKDNQAVLPLINALKDEDSEVRKVAALALGYIGDKRALPHLKWLRQNYDNSLPPEDNEMISDAAIEAIELINQSC